MVIDTNVLVSAVIRDRLPERLLLWCLNQMNLVWLVTPDILREYAEVIQRPKFNLPPSAVSWWLELVLVGTRMIYPIGDIPFPRDRKDSIFLICAQDGKADYFITGDGDFSEAQALIRSEISTVVHFVEMFAPELLVRQ